MKALKSIIPAVLFIIFIITSTSCTSVPKNKLPLYQRSVVVENKQIEQEILKKASLVASNDPAVNNIKVLYLKGSPYEMGFQHGRLDKQDVQANVNHIIWLVRHYAAEDMMDEIYDLMDPYIPIEEKEEMRGLAHGADMPLRVIHWLHCVPEVSEYGQKKRFMEGELGGTSCSNIVAMGKATVDGDVYQIRVLDWIRQLGAQKYPVIIVRQPDHGNASVTFSYAGFIGCISGMNEKHMAFGEMGYGDPPGESLQGIPFIFLFRKLMREANTIDDAVQMIKDAHRTCSYAYMISDVKAKDPDKKALLFISDRSRVLYFHENQKLVDERDGTTYPAIDDVVYGGAKEDELYGQITKYYGKISVNTLKEISKKVALKGNMQDVIFKPSTLETWVANAATASRDKKGMACNQRWVYFNFGNALKK